MDVASEYYQEVTMQTIPRKKKCKMAKWLSEETLQIAEKRREMKGREEKKDIFIWMQSYKNSKDRLKKKKKKPS